MTARKPATEASRRARPLAAQRACEAAAEAIADAMSVSGTDEQWWRCVNLLMSSIGTRLAVIHPDLSQHYWAECERLGVAKPGQRPPPENGTP